MGADIMLQEKHSYVIGHNQNIGRWTKRASGVEQVSFL